MNLLQYILIFLFGIIIGFAISYIFTRKVRKACAEKEREYQITLKRWKQKIEKEIQKEDEKWRKEKKLAANGTLTTYSDLERTKLKSVYKDKEEKIAWPNPIKLDSEGLLPGNGDIYYKNCIYLIWRNEQGEMLLNERNYSYNIPVFREKM